jgi:hypothetical protein
LSEGERAELDALLLEQWYIDNQNRYRSHPDEYAREVLGVELTPEQTGILQSLVENRRTAAKASHAIGKTFTAAVAACWWYDCWDEHIVYITAPTWKQCLGLTFKQVKRFRRSKRMAGEILESGVVRDEDKDAAGAHFIQALNAESGEGFQGEHAAPILIIVEEAVGVPTYIFEAIDGLMTHPDCRVLEIANPTDEATSFGDHCSSSVYNVLSVSVFDHPNIEAELRCEPPPFPLAVRLLWLKEMLEKECDRTDEQTGDAFEFYSLPVIEAAINGRSIRADSEKWFYLPNAVFQGRALGEFPTQADRQAIPRGWLTNLPILEPEGKPEIGCDTARFGTDRTTIFVKQGPCALRGREVRMMDNVAVASALREESKEAERLTGYPARCAKVEDGIPIKIDTTGGLGTGPYDMLKSEGYNVIAVNSSSTDVNEPDSFKNIRSELYWATRENARLNRLDFSRLPKDIRENLIRELSTPTWKPDSAGRKIVAEKEKIKKDLGFSPDLADGWNLANYKPRSQELNFDQSANSLLSSL